MRTHVGSFRGFSVLFKAFVWIENSHTSVFFRSDLFSPQMCAAFSELPSNKYHGGEENYVQAIIASNNRFHAVFFNTITGCHYSLFSFLPNQYAIKIKSASFLNAFWDRVSNFGWIKNNNCQSFERLGDPGFWFEYWEYNVYFSLPSDQQGQPKFDTSI